MLYVIPTPIGNLEDITFRAVNTLKTADLIIVESAQKSKKLFKKYLISAPIIINNTFNESKKLNYIISKIKSVENACLISDSGTPGISDPGFLIIRECIALNIRISCLPGPSALIPALIQSGFPCEKFVFEGFLPKKKGKESRLNILLKDTRSIIIYESPHRILKTLELIQNKSPDRKLVIVKELTKIHEKTYRGSINSILKEFKQLIIKGEYILILEGNND